MVQDFYFPSRRSSALSAAMEPLRPRVAAESPFGSPPLTLFYRRDLFEKLGLQPPESWAKYREAVTRLADRKALGDLAPAAGAQWQGTVEPWGPGWAGQVLLARAAGYANHRNLTNHKR